MADRRVRPDGVVLNPPSLDLGSCVLQAQKPRGIEAFLPEAAVEGLDIGIVRGFAGPREVQDDALGVSPEIKVPADELGAIVEAHPPRTTMRVDGLLQGLDHIAPL